MNGTPHEQPQPDPASQVICANCAFWQNIRPDGLGECWRHPPAVIVLFSQKPDLAIANVSTIQRPTNVRPTMPGESMCGDFVACPQGWRRRVLQPAN